MTEKEYIERGALRSRDTFGKEDILLINGKTFVNFDRVMDAIVNVPTADVVEVRHGKWLPHEIEQLVDPFINPHYNIETFKPLNYRCNLCGRIEERKEPYCNCGAKMDGKGEGE